MWMTRDSLPVGPPPGIVGRQLVAGAVGFVRLARDLELHLSLGVDSRVDRKSILVTNHPRIASIVRQHLAHQGVQMKVESTARDLGALLVGGARRRTSNQHFRMRGGG